MKEAVDSIIFLDFMREYGFRVEDYDATLELFNSVELSMAKFLRAYKVFLLSTKVDSKSLISCNLRGAFGYLKEGEISIPSNSINDMLFNKKNKYYYNHPFIKSFDCIIGYGLSNEIDELPNNDIFIGDICDKDSVYKTSAFDRYKALASKMGYDYFESEYNHLNKSMCLVRHKI